MRSKKLISLLCALAMSASSFAGLTLTANAATDADILWSDTFNSYELTGVDYLDWLHNVLVSGVGAGSKTYTGIEGAVLYTGTKNDGDDSTYWSMGNDAENAAVGNYLTTASGRFTTVDRGASLAFGSLNESDNLVATPFAASAENDIVLNMKFMGLPAWEAANPFNNAFTVTGTDASGNSVSTELNMTTNNISLNEWHTAKVVTTTSGTSIYIDGSTTALSTSNATSITGLKFSAFVNGSPAVSGQEYRNTGEAGAGTKAGNGMGYPAYNFDDIVVFKAAAGTGATTEVPAAKTHGQAQVTYDTVPAGEAPEGMRLVAKDDLNDKTSERLVFINTDETAATYDALETVTLSCGTDSSTHSETKWEVTENGKTDPKLGTEKYLKATSSLKSAANRGPKMTFKKGEIAEREVVIAQFATRLHANTKEGAEQPAEVIFSGDLVASESKGNLSSPVAMITTDAEAESGVYACDHSLEKGGANVIEVPDNKWVLVTIEATRPQSKAVNAKISVDVDGEKTYILGTETAGVDIKDGTNGGINTLPFISFRSGNSTDYYGEGSGSDTINDIDNIAVYTSSEEDEKPVEAHAVTVAYDSATGAATVSTEETTAFSGTFIQVRNNLPITIKKFTGLSKDAPKTISGVSAIEGDVFYVWSDTNSLVPYCTAKVITADEGKKSYDITAAKADNGTVTVNPTKASEGEIVKVTATPADGYELDTLTAKGADNTAVEIKDGKFTMPAQAVTVTATFKAKTYAVTVATAANGEVKVTGADDLTKVAEGTELTVTATAADGYELEKLEVKDAAGKTVTVTGGKFKMPASAVTVTATFKATSVTNPTPTPTGKPATPTPTAKPATPTPTGKPATPTPTAKPATPTPTAKPATPTPTAKPATPTPTAKPATPTPVPTPDITGTVAIEGTAKVGETLKAKVTGLNTGKTARYQWKANTGAEAAYEDIADATAETYAVPAVMLGKSIKVVVTADGTKGSIESAAVGPVAAKTYKVSGTVDAGVKKVTLTPATGDPIEGTIANGKVTFKDVAAGKYTISAELNAGFKDLAIKLGDAAATEVTVAAADITNLVVTSTAIALPDLSGKTVMAENNCDTADDVWGFTTGRNGAAPANVGGQIVLTKGNNANNSSDQRMDAKTFDEAVIASTDTELVFDYQSNIQGTKNRWATFSVTDSSDNIIISLASMGQQGIGYAVGERAVFESNALKAPAVKVAGSWADGAKSDTLRVYLHFVKGETENKVSGYIFKVPEEGEPAFVAEIAETTVAAANVGKLVAQEGYSLAPQAIDNIKLVTNDENWKPAIAVTVTDPAAADGKLSVDKKSAIKGSVITITATPEAGKKLVAVKVNDTAITAVEGAYTYTATGEETAIAVTAEFARADVTAVNITSTNASVQKGQQGTYAAAVMADTTELADQTITWNVAVPTAEQLEADETAVASIAENTKIENGTLTVAADQAEGILLVTATVKKDATAADGDDNVVVGTFKVKIVAEPVYQVAKATLTNGDVEFKVGEQAVEAVKQSETLTIVPKPEAGYEVEAVTYKYAEGEPVTVAKTGEAYTVAGSALTGNITVTVTFKAINYTITNSNADVKIMVDGKEIAAPITATIGQKISIVPANVANKKIKTVAATKTGDEETKVTVENNSFTMPAYDVTVTAEVEDWDGVYFSQDYEAADVTADWVSVHTDRYTADIKEADGNHYMSIDAVDSGNNGTTITSAVPVIGADQGYTMEFDLALNGGNNQLSAFAVKSAEAGKYPLVLQLNAASGTEYTLNGTDKITIDKGVFYHYKIEKTSLGVKVTVTSIDGETKLIDGKVYLNGTNTSGEFSGVVSNAGINGMQFNTKRYYAGMKIDNVSVKYAADEATYESKVTVTSDGNAVEGAAVAVSLNGAVIATVNSAAETGVASFNLPAGTYTVAITKDGYKDKLDGSLTVAADGANAETIAIEVDRDPVHEVTVKTSPFATVKLNAGKSTVGTDVAEQTVKADKDGITKFELPVGNYTVDITSANKYLASETASAVAIAADTTEVDKTLAYKAEYANMIFGEDFSGYTEDIYITGGSKAGGTMLAAKGTKYDIWTLTNSSNDWERLAIRGSKNTKDPALLHNTLLDGQYAYFGAFNSDAVYTGTVSENIDKIELDTNLDGFMGNLSSKMGMTDMDFKLGDTVLFTLTAKPGVDPASISTIGIKSGDRVLSAKGAWVHVEITGLTSGTATVKVTKYSTGTTLSDKAEDTFTATIENVTAGNVFTIFAPGTNIVDAGQAGGGMALDNVEIYKAAAAPAPNPGA